jgi:F-type H+-transporting ATPase subunit delta
MQTDALAQVYAKSLYELADEAGGREKILEIAGELEQVCELTRAEESFREFLASPIIATGRRSAALGSIFRDRVTDLTLRFLLVLNNKGRLGHLEAINAAFDEMVQEAHGRIEVDLYTAAPLGDEQAAIIAQRIHEAMDREPILHRYTDESMLGGLKLRIGDQLIDGSVATRLGRLKQSLLAGGASTVRERFSEIIDEGGAA